MSTQLLLAVADDTVRAQTQVALAELPDIELVGTVSTSSDLMAVMAGDIDIVLVHPSVGPMPYLAVCKELSSRRPDVAVGLLTALADSETLARAMEVGVRNVLSDSPTVAELQTALAPMIEWVRTVRALTAGRAGAAAVARMVMFLGAKGGVGTSTIALHVALLAAKADRGRRVCIVDLDLQQGGLAHLLDVTPRRSIADLALVAEGISGRNIDESVFVHRSSLRLLPAPRHGEQAEDLDARAARQILAAIKGHYDVVVVDGGSVLTEVGATALELSDDVFLVTTADVASLRAGRDTVQMLGRLHVRKEDEIITVVNRVSPKQEVQPELARRIVGTQITRISLPADWNRLQSVTNSAQPEDLEDGPFRRAVTALTRDLGLLPAATRGGNTAAAAAAASSASAGPAAVEAPPAKGGRRRGGRKSASANATAAVVPAAGASTGAPAGPAAPGAPAPTGADAASGVTGATREAELEPSDSGQIALEGAIGVVAAVLLFLVMMQLVAVGLSLVMAERAADSAAVAGSRATTGSALGSAQHAADERLPDWLPGTVSRQSGGSQPDEYRVAVKVPTMLSGVWSFSLSVGATASD